jgi:TRAP-type C4-dicarboxylate transport system permease small subunit
MERMGHNKIISRSWIDSIKSFKRKVNIIFIWGSSLLITFLVLLNIGEVISRYLIGRSIYWVHDVSILLMTWIVFLGTAIYFHLKKYVKVDYFVKNLSGFWKNILDLSILSVIISFCIVVCFGSIEYYIIQSGMHTEVMHIPYNLFTIPLFLFAASVLLDSVLDFLDSARDIIYRGISNSRVSRKEANEHR